MADFLSTIDYLEEEETIKGYADDNYDPRKGDKAHCYTPIRDQAHCGSCWAFATATVLSDRYCLFANTSVILSPQDLVSCDTVLNKGCDGGNPVAAWEYCSLKGIVSDECYPYVSGNGTTGTCEIKNGNCVTNAVYKKYKSGQPKIVRDRETIKTTLKQGPVEAAMMVYDDFPSYKDGVYVKTSSTLLGGHAVRMIGYGYDAKTSLNYWIVANSWGKGWGQEGYFYIKMGECSIDSACTYANPK